MAAEDRAYLVRMVMARTGLAQPDAERRVTEVIAQAQRAIRRARANAVILAFMAAASLLAGAAVAWFAAGFGGRHRDGEPLPAFWLNRPGVPVRGYAVDRGRRPGDRIRPRAEPSPDIPRSRSSQSPHADTARA